MNKRFVSALLATAFCLVLPAMTSAADSMEGGFIHHVFFWLKEPDNAEHRELFLKEMEKLKQIPTIKLASVGEPAGTAREVVDSSWTFDWLVVFEDQTGWKVYNDHEIHLQFGEKASHLWEKVQVYDTLIRD